MDLTLQSKPFGLRTPHSAWQQWSWAVLPSWPYCNRKDYVDICPGKKPSDLCRAWTDGPQALHPDTGERRLACAGCEIISLYLNSRSAGPKRRSSSQRGGQITWQWDFTDQDQKYHATQHDICTETCLVQGPTLRSRFSASSLRTSSLRTTVVHLNPVLVCRN